MLGHDPGNIFKGRIVWARPDAFQRVAGLARVTARRCAEVGPVLALQCAHGEGMHADGRDWTVEVIGGILAFTSRMKRITPFDQVSSGVRGRVLDGVCACGNADPLIERDGGGWPRLARF